MREASSSPEVERLLVGLECWIARMNKIVAMLEDSDPRPPHERPDATERPRLRVVSDRMAA